MSSTAVKVAGLPASGKSAPRSPLAVVPARPVVRQGWFLLAMLATLVMSLLATLLINTALAEGSYERGQLVTESTVLALTRPFADEQVTVRMSALGRDGVLHGAAALRKDYHHSGGAVEGVGARLA